VKIIWLNADELLIAGQQCVADCVDNGRFAAIISPNERSDAVSECDVEGGSIVTELTKIANGQTR